jgi:hypothetical protein
LRAKPKTNNNEGRVVEVDLLVVIDDAEVEPIRKVQVVAEVGVDRVDDIIVIIIDVLVVHIRRAVDLAHRREDDVVLLEVTAALRSGLYTCIVCK